MTPPARITVASLRDLRSLKAEWRGLERDADPSFFQSWTWVGCRAATRFPEPWLLRVERGGRSVGLALLNRRDGRLWLNESGSAELDAPFVEHNGVLLARGERDLLPSCLATLLGAAGRLHLSGVDAAHLDAARAVAGVRVRRESLAPFVDLAALPEAPDGYLAGRSANTRQQLRRSDRSYGSVTLRRAGSVEEAEAFLDALAALHQARWTARGQPGAFANPEFLRFHRALLTRAVPRGEADLLRIDGDRGPIGYLYNFRLNGRVFAYQGGFDYAGAGRHGKPGLTCHHAAIRQAAAEGARAYDFLAGADRYKLSLADGATPLYWLTAASARSAAGLALRLADWASTWRKTASRPRLVSSRPNGSA